MAFSLSHQLVRAARMPGTGNQVCDPDSEHTWRDVAERVALLAGAMKKLGVNSGDRVAILAMNSSEYLCLYFAIPWAGGVTVPVNIRLAPEEIIYWLDDSGSGVLLVDEAFVAVAQKIAPSLSSVAHIVYVGSGPTPDGMKNLQELTRDCLAIDDAGRADDDTALLFYTGGTTGKSKGVMLTHTGLIFNALQWAHAVGVGETDTLLVAIPMFHLAAGLNCIASMVLAARLVILPRFDAERTLQVIQEHKVTKAAFVPAVLDMLINHPAFASTDTSSLARITYGGAPMPLRILEQARKMLPHTRFYQIYGQTESGGVATCLAAEYHVLEGGDGNKMSTAGRPVVGTDLKIVSPENHELPPGAVGEICLRGPALTPGYWKLPEQTAALYSGDWLHTGDVGYLDADGFLTIVDRIKDMIISGGENVFAAEVEAVLYQHPAVAECAVIGIPSEQWGEQVHAVVRAKEGSAPSEQELIDFCRSKLAAYKCIRSVDFSDEPLPASSMNKILKRELRSRYREGRR